MGGFVVPDHGGEGEDPLQDSCPHAGWGAAAVAFEVELALQGLVDGLVNANATGRPDGVVMRCRRRPQKYREWDAP